MEMEHGKLFIGGISWDTNEERLKEYFESFGEVIEAVIMKDRTTGRARGFGFVVFSDPVVAERVVKEKHTIDGRTVEAKKAVPRDDQQVLPRSNGSIQGSPGPTRTKKIFVGGLASSVTESDFKTYFDQFGIITDVVVMYDHNTQRPRGFGFITYDSEESVDKALLKTFHELNGKMVEVKRAVPKESSPGPNRGQISGFNYGLSGRASSFLNGYSQGYNSPSYGGRMDGGRFSPVTVGRNGFPPFSPSAYNLGLNSDSILGMNYGNGNGNGNFGSNLGYPRAISPMYGGGSSRYGDPIGYGVGGNGGGGNTSLMNSTNHNMWGSGAQSFTTNSSPNLSNFLAPGNGSGGIGAIWGSSGGGGGGGGGGFVGGNLGYGNEEGTIGYRRNNGNGITPGYSYGVIDDGEIGGGNSYGGGGGGGGGRGGGGGGGSFYGDATWRSSSPELEVPDLFGYSLGSGVSDDIPKNSVGYVGYSVTNRSNRGIAA